MTSGENVGVVLLLSSFGAGSTAVSGYLDRCGAHTCPPHHRTNDPRAPNAYEPKAYRDALVTCIDELRLRPRGNTNGFVRFFEKWLVEEKIKAEENGRPLIALKHPLQAFLLPGIEGILQPKYVVITRPFADIEKTRLRRNWHPVYGEKGARTIYNTIYSFTHANGKHYIAVPYDGFLSDRELRDRLLGFVGLDPNGEQRRDAETWLR